MVTENTSTNTVGLKPFDPFIFPRRPSQDHLHQHKHYLINWFKVPPYIQRRLDPLHYDFKKCKYTNCIVTTDRNDRRKSDMVLFDGRMVSDRVEFVRPPGQVWVFAAHEAPDKFDKTGGRWRKPQWRSGFNWTMTYDKDNTDIHLPYGEIRKHPKIVNRDYKRLALLKTQGALMISSHCKTSSHREIFVKELSQYMPIEVLGSCGKAWNCGARFKHDECFNLLNTTYKFYLAFENAFCHQYFSEKLYDNFNYDVISVVRGGSYEEALSVFPKGIIISTDSFKSIGDLGRYLGKLSRSVNDYAEMLKRKSQYYSPRYPAVYHRAMCDLCERMNNQEKYHQTIPDIAEWAYNKKPCRNATGLQ